MLAGNSSWVELFQHHGVCDPYCRVSRHVPLSLFVFVNESAHFFSFYCHISVINHARLSLKPQLLGFAGIPDDPASLVLTAVLALVLRGGGRAAAAEQAAENSPASGHHRSVPCSGLGEMGEYLYLSTYLLTYLLTYHTAVHCTVLILLLNWKI